MNDKKRVLLFPSRYLFSIAVVAISKTQQNESVPNLADSYIRRPLTGRSLLESSGPAELWKLVVGDEILELG